ncbi:MULTISPECIES: DUF6678 family protein [unclassified Clostridium]|uniref:DUF6678 family protein n=1 Tax=unclassified Clostridium TaxID=2614128 RepID=UPI0002E56C2D|nr:MULTISPECIES: DUF6678 family protein [unclassified Clostridium]NFR85934.1 hypothetical protein [Clostridium botulinum]NFR91332.1 hypothetical protein [Clostridium botulinum]NFS30014.1 hypothetical protein [Clostridium botulinum]NFS54550.1 hypothetical protein [Clostridium botulinum]NFT17520.1 hypothetical protein [Clostridium botulinum]
MISIENERIQKSKKKAREYIEKEQLVSFMNNTKWEEFRKAMLEEMPFPPPYIIKTIYEVEDNSTYYTHFTSDVNYFGGYDEESFVYLKYYLIEWIKVRPRYYETKGGRLCPKKVIHDAEKEFLIALNKYNINYKKDNDIYVIYGYKRD